MRFRHVLSTVAAAMLAAACGPFDTAPTTFTSELAGENEVPAVATTAGGTVTATRDGDQLTVQGAFEGLMSDLRTVGGSSAHVHQAPAGSNGPVVADLTVTTTDERSGTVSGTIDLDASLLAAFVAGQLYVNIHTDGNAAGELRAQLVPDAPTFAPVAKAFDALLSPDNEPHDVVSGASGSAVGILREDGTLTVSGSFTDLESSLHDIGDMGPAHVHEGPFGEGGPVAFALDVVPGEAMTSGRFGASATLDEEDVATLLVGGYHVNVHTADEPQGELRGQLFPTIVETTAMLDGDQQVPSVETAASGTATASTDGFVLTVTGTFEDLSSELHDVGEAGPAHVHVAPRGANGDVVYVLDVATPDVPTAGTFSLETVMTEGERADFVAGRHYVNIHTTLHEDGEIRGQFEPFAAGEGNGGGVIYGE